MELEETGREEKLEMVRLKEDRHRESLKNDKQPGERMSKRERTTILKLILSKKLGEKKLRKMMIKMEQLTLEDLEMEVEEVQAKITELMK